MPDSVPALHHVVFCVHREHQDGAADFWRGLGFEFIDIDLVEEGLRVLLDWSRGIEVISPTDPSRAEATEVVKFLEQQGEGVYSVVVRTADADASVSIAERYGATVEFRQHRDGTFPLDEVRLSPLHGMSVTILVTDMPG